MSLEEREAKVKLLSHRENRLSLTSNPTNNNNTTTNNNNNNNHNHNNNTYGQVPGPGPGQGLGLAPGAGFGQSKAVTFAAEGFGLASELVSGLASRVGLGSYEDGNELSEEDMRY